MRPAPGRIALEVERFRKPANAASIEPAERVGVPVSGQRVESLGSDIQERSERKRAVRELRMRNREPRALNHPAVDPQEIQVEGAWSPPFTPLPAGLALEREQAIEQLLGVRAGLEPDRSVQEERLRGTDGRGLVQPRDTPNVRAESERAHGGSKQGMAVAEVRPESDDGVEASLRHCGGPPASSPGYDPEGRPAQGVEY